MILQVFDGRIDVNSLSDLLITFNGIMQGFSVDFVPISSSK